MAVFFHLFLLLLFLFLSVDLFLLLFLSVDLFLLLFLFVDLFLTCQSNALFCFFFFVHNKNFFNGKLLANFLSWFRKFSWKFLLFTTKIRKQNETKQQQRVDVVVVLRFLLVVVVVAVKAWLQGTAMLAWWLLWSCCCRRRLRCCCYCCCWDYFVNCPRKSAICMESIDWMHLISQ